MEWPWKTRLERVFSDLNHCWEANQGIQPLWNTTVSNLSRRQAGPSHRVHKAKQQQNQTNDRTTRFRKCPTMCILFHIIIQCLHSYNSRENAFSLPITYVVLRSLTLTWRIGKGAIGTEPSPHWVGRDHKHVSWEGMGILQDQRGFQTLGFEEHGHTEPMFSRRATQDKNKLVLDRSLDCIRLNKRHQGSFCLN